MAEKPDYKAMTLNERLFESGLTREFDQARLNWDRAKIVEILKALEVDDVEWTANAIVGPPIAPRS
jgi:hypothetical protein